ncbi:MAG TPA: NAD(P)/FAD-dependent oxidoreductase [Thermomicrobiales bacterium]|nr:NAD(P)/FAD-dependent oxidoreductase [Thermomicrobiales bacterium]
MAIQQPSDLHDVLVVGGGPAGVSAAITLARACRSVTVVDCLDIGRSDWRQRNRNYPGFPDGITAVELSRLGRQQAEQYGAHFIVGEVARLVQADSVFVASGEDFEVQARSVILATGVRDRWPVFPGYESYIGKTMHWCLYCDGYEMRGKRVVLVGNDEDAAQLAVQFLAFTDDVTLLTNSGSLGLPQALVERLASRGIPTVIGRLTDAKAKGDGILESITIDDRESLPLDHLFSHQGADPNTELARALGVELNEYGYIDTDLHARTSLPGVYAAGDVTRRFSHQVATAIHEGTTAATTIDFELFERDQAALDLQRVSTLAG